ncbi:MAG TPA: peptidoglycan recognition family protein [Blastocatellia bacterium]
MGTNFKIQDTRYAKLVDEYSRHIKSPVLRLKFLQSALREDAPHKWAGRIPFFRSLPERARLVVELSKVLPPGQSAPLSFRLASIAWRLRYLAYALCLCIALSAGAGLVFLTSKIISRFSTPTEAKEVASQPDATARANVGDAVASIAAEAGLTLDKVWLAEEGEGYEFYSNGARILTEYQTDGPERSFYRFDMEARSSDDLMTRPVGIIYHLSEGDLLPFDDQHNSSLQDRSKALLEYARNHQLYNYVIDRFGRAYRIVRDEQTANHAGNSLWSDGHHLYVNLSPSFIGICFEGRSDRKKTVGPDGINEAQIYAARVLTAVLRSKYQIEDANCVTHGLVSINPANKLMGYHTDWVAGFPFEALGLTNKYDFEVLAVSRFGFNYDQAYVNAAGGRRWTGLEKADAALKEFSHRDGLSTERGREERWKIYQRAYSKQHALDEARAKGE